MDTLLSAVGSDLMSRLVSFLIGKYQVGSGADATDTAVRLQRALLRARVVVEEAEGRQIANRAMLHQLSQLRRELCRAAYALDAARWRDRRSHLKVRRSRPHARPLPSSDCSEVLSVMVGSLEAALSDMREFVVLLGACPRVTKQPYNTYLFMENCMFGRQLEKKQIIGFFLSQPPPSHEDLDVLPVIGAHEVGKRTLVEHVCLDDRVRERFAKVHRLRSEELREHDWSVFDFSARMLVLVDMVDGDTDAADESWTRFHTSFRRRARKGSRIIVISRAEAAHASLGTVPPLRLQGPRREELWYLFRALAFGSADPDDRSDLARIAMALCERIHKLSPFVAANIIAASLRADLSARSWRRVLTVFSEATVLQLDSVSDGFDEGWVGRCCFFQPEKDVNAAPFLFYNRRQLTGAVQRDQLPKVTMLELLAGGSLPPAAETRFDVLVWQSRIPPYASYIESSLLTRPRPHSY